MPRSVIKPEGYGDPLGRYLIRYGIDQKAFARLVGVSPRLLSHSRHLKCELGLSKALDIEDATGGEVRAERLPLTVEAWGILSRLRRLPARLRRVRRLAA